MFKSFNSIKKTVEIAESKDEPPAWEQQLKIEFNLIFELEGDSPENQVKYFAIFQPKIQKAMTTQTEQMTLQMTQQTLQMKDALAAQSTTLRAEQASQANANAQSLQQASAPPLGPWGPDWGWQRYTHFAN